MPHGDHPLHAARGHGCNSIRAAARTLALGALVLTGCADQHATEPLPPGQVFIDAVRDFGAVPTPDVDSEPMIQAALDEAAARAPAVVYLPRGRYGIGRPLIVRSGVHLRGDGPGVTVLQSLPAQWGKVEQGAGVTAAIGLVAADSASVRRLTVDLATAHTHSNGIALLPAGASYEGRPATRSEVSDTEVLGGGDYHAYMIWSLRGRDIRIVRNRADGRVVPGGLSYQEGIEAYGGRNVLVGWNTVRNVGGAGLNFGSAGLADTGIEGLQVIGNEITNAGVGVHIGTVFSEHGAQNLTGVRIEENTIRNVVRSGIQVIAPAGTAVRDLLISGNLIERVEGGDVPARGVYVQGYPELGGLPATLTSGVIVRGNVIDDVRGEHGHGVLSVFFPGLSVQGNRITQADHSGIYALASDSLVAEGNVIAEVGRHGVFSAGSPSRIYLRGNEVSAWDTFGAGSAAVSIHDASRGAVRLSVFVMAVATMPAVRVEASASDVIVFDNRYAGSWTKVLPVINLGANSNRGTFTVSAGDTLIMVAHPLVRRTSALRVTRWRGEPLAFTATAEEGLIRVAFPAAAKAVAEFYFAVDP